MKHWKLFSGNGAEYCWDHTYQSVLDHLRDEDYYDDMDRQWAYQKCTEFGWYKSSDQPGHPYGTKFPIETSVKVWKTNVKNHISVFLL